MFDFYELNELMEVKGTFLSKRYVTKSYTWIGSLQMSLDYLKEKTDIKKQCS